MSKRKRHRRSGGARTTSGEGRGRGEWAATTPERAPLIPLTDAALKAMIPSGLSSTWTVDEWNAFDLRYERLKLADQDKMWLMVMAHDAELGDPWDVQSTTDADEHMAKISEKAIMEMTEDEWSVYSTFTSSLDEPIQPALPAPPPKGPCNCKGPGHPQQKWQTHTPSCPADDGVRQPGFQGSGTVYKPHPEHNAQPVLLLEGIKVYASARYSVKNEYDGARDFGIYLADSWTRDEQVATLGTQIPWQTIRPHHPIVGLSWPDRKRPTTDVEEMVAMCSWVLKAAKEGLRIEFGCIGGHGRTGTALACLLVAQGLNPYEAVVRLWDDEHPEEGGYCTKAVEDPSQLTYIGDVYEEIHGKWVMTTEQQKEYSEWVHKYFTSPVYQAPKGVAAAAGSIISKSTSMFNNSHMGKGV